MPKIMCVRKKLLCCSKDEVYRRLVFLVQKQESEMKVCLGIPSNHKEEVFVGHANSP